MNETSSTHPPLYAPAFLSDGDRAAIVAWLASVHPLWENRYPDDKPLRHGQTKRRLLRPVYWLGNWQFACLEYFRPPRGTSNRCVRAEPFPPCLVPLVRKMETLAREAFAGPDLPAGWTLNTCLINLYGLRREGERWIDSARVKAHKDFEPGPVASLSLGERALFQFVEHRFPEPPGPVIAEQWLEDASLQIFGGPKWKDQTLHRVDRVERRGGHRFDSHVSDFKTRRVNFTFRWVPEEFIVNYAELEPVARQNITGYFRTLAKTSPFFAAELAKVVQYHPPNGSTGKDEPVGHTR